MTVWAYGYWVTTPRASYAKDAIADACRKHYVNGYYHSLMDRHNILRMIVVKKFFCRFLTKLELFVVYFSFVNNTLEGGYCAVHTHSTADNNRISLLESLLPSLSLFLDLFLVADTRL